ncbi:MAG: IS21 family transposase [Nitrospiria bacterium]
MTRLSMRKIREVFRLAFEVGLSKRKIARSLSISHPTVIDYLSKAKSQGLTWPLPDNLDDITLEKILSGPPKAVTRSNRPQPDWLWVRKELRKKGVTLQLLWEEYKTQEPSGLQYSQFCECYSRFDKTLDLVLRQEHKGGEKMFVDYAGQTVPIIDPQTGEITSAQIFVAVLGASNYTYAEATVSQDLPSWIGSHIRAFEYFGGVPFAVIPDNLKSAVTRACRYEPDLNPTYQEMAAYYGVAILPARVRKPRDKAKAETGVLIAERRILAVLRNHTFFRLSALNQSIAGLLEPLNTRPFKKLPGNRRELFEVLDKPALKPLPQTPYEYAEWKKARVNIDYHIEVLGHYYSLPYTYVHQQVDVRLTVTAIECFHKGIRIASHPRNHQKGRHTTQIEHMPLSHQRTMGWTPTKMIQWGESIGHSTAQIIATILVSRPHPEQGIRSCLGVFRLAKSYGNERLEAACHKALALKVSSYKLIAAILKSGMDQKPLDPPKESSLPDHDNIRGEDYYQTEPV